MSKRTLLALAGLVAVIGIAALVSAQESSRRTASKFRTPEPLTPPGAAPLPAEGLSTAPSGTPASPAAPYGQPAIAIPADAGVPDGAPAPAAVPSPTEAASAPVSLQPYSPQGVTSKTVAGEADGLPSVLKRSRPASVYESSAPTPAEAPSAAHAADPELGQAPAAQLPAQHAPGQAFAPSGLTSGTVLPPTSSRGGLTSGSAIGGAGALARSGRSIQELALRGQSPPLRVEIAGPHGVTVGKPATVVINLHHDGEQVAEEVQVRIAAPPSVTLQPGRPTGGEVRGPAEGSIAARGLPLIWSLPRVAPRSHEQLKVQLVAGSSEPFELAVDWTCKPAALRAAMVVKQPQLELSLAGPAEMTFGEEKTFTLTVSNAGNGDAERVVIAVAAGESPPQQLDAGTIPAGYKKEIPLVVTAAQAGLLELKCAATGEGGLTAQTSARIQVRKAELALMLDGPSHKFAGTEAVYPLTIHNQGTAVAENVELTLSLPPGARYLGGIEGSTAGPAAVRWKLAKLAAGMTRTYDIRLMLATPGANAVRVHAQAACGEAEASIQTEVEAVADLKLVVNDPTGPLPVDRPAVYEVQVVNRGTQAAHQVRIVMQFSEGVEPEAFEGCQARIVPGQVLCQPLPELGAGEQVTLRIKAKAQQAGAHRFRVEVTSPDASGRLVTEGTTRFYVETGRTTPAARTASQPPPASSSVR